MQSIHVQRNTMITVRSMIGKVRAISLKQRLARVSLASVERENANRRENLRSYEGPARAPSRARESRTLHACAVHVLCMCCACAVHVLCMCCACAVHSLSL